MLGNPPYIQLQNDGGVLANLYADKGYETFIRSGDIYCLFYELGYKLLKEGGHLCFITSNKWMRAGYGETLRRFFAIKTKPKLLIDFAGIQLFDNVTVDNNILLYQKGENDHSCQTLAVGDGLRTGSELANYINTNLTLSHNFVDSATWVISSPIEDRIRQKIEALGMPLGEWDINIFYGIKTGYNNAFVVNGQTRDLLIKQDPNSSKILKPILRGRDVKRYKADFANLWLIDSHNGYVDTKGNQVAAVDIYKYPAILAWLNFYWTEIFERGDQGITQYNLRHCAYHEKFDETKIIWAELARTGNSFVLDTEGFFTLAGTFILTFGHDDSRGYSYKYLVSMLNHPSTLLYLEFVYSKLDVTGWQWKKEPFEKIPIPRASYSDQQSIIRLYDEFMNSPKMERLERLSKLDKKIFDYLGFTDEEIKHTFNKLSVFSEEEQFFLTNILS